MCSKICLLEQAPSTHTHLKHYLQITITYIYYMLFLYSVPFLQKYVWACSVPKHWEKWEGYSLFSWLQSLGERRKLPQWGPRQSPAEVKFCKIWMQKAIWWHIFHWIFCHNSTLELVPQVRGSMGTACPWQKTRLAMPCPCCAKYSICMLFVPNGMSKNHFLLNNIAKKE